MSSRRSHTKSRKGCYQCKKSRIKCDEKRPICSKCIKSGSICSLSDPASSLLVIDVSRSRSTQQASFIPEKPARNGTSQPVSRAASAHDTDRGYDLDGVHDDPYFTPSERTRLRLMNHYDRHTCQTIANLTFLSNENLSPWHEYVPKLAFKHDFLLHGLLAFSSLHMALLEGSSEKEHISLAINHHNLGSRLFRQQLSQVSAENVDALFAFSCLVALYAFGITRVTHTEQHPLTQITETLLFIHGSGTVVNTGYHWLRQGPWSPLFASQATDPTQKLPDEIEEALAILSARVSSTPASEAEVYIAAIAVLRRNFLLATKRPQAQMILVHFPVMAHDHFFPLLQARRPLALAITANYAVILHSLRANIWMDRCGEQMMDALLRALPRDWHDCTAWAEEQIRSGSPIQSL